MKPCYLMGKPGMRVALDGPALSVSVPGRALTLLPLQRISRVIASGPVDWSTAALLACAERGVTVTFLQGDGSVHAYLFGASARRDDLLCRLRDLLDRPDWPERYEDWRKAMRSRARRSLCRRLGLAPDALSESQLTEALQRSRSHYVNPGQRRYLERRLQGLTAALVAELLGRVGLTAESTRCLNGRLHLLDDITQLLMLDLQLPILNWLSRRSDSADRLDDKKLVCLFESRSKRLERVTRSVLNRLHGWLAELLI